MRLQGYDERPRVLAPFGLLNEIITDATLAKVVARIFQQRTMASLRSTQGHRFRRIGSLVCVGTQAYSVAHYRAALTGGSWEFDYNVISAQPVYKTVQPGAQARTMSTNDDVNRITLVGSRHRRRPGRL